MSMFRGSLYLPTFFWKYILFRTLPHGMIIYSTESEKGNVMDYTGPERRVKERRIHRRRNDATRIHTHSNSDRRKSKRRGM